MVSKEIDRTIDHFVIAPSPWESDNLKFRRHRIVEKLLCEKNTGKIYWIFPLSIHNKAQYEEYFYKQVKEIEINGKKIVSIGLFDLKSFFKNQYIFNPKDKKVLKKIRTMPGENERYLWFTTPAFPGLLSSKFSWQKIIYDCSDLWSKPFHSQKGLLFLPDKLRNVFTKNAEIKIIKKADILLATSEFLAKNIRKYTQKEVEVIENGVEFTYFQESVITENIIERFRNIPHPRIGFVGGLKDKIDFQLIKDLAQIKKEFSIVLVGPVPSRAPENFNDLLKMENVYFLGAVNSKEVPQYIKLLDLGILPYKSIAYNEAVSPLKIFEYLACGIPATGTGLPVTDKYATEGIYSHTQKSEFITSCIEMLKLSKNKNFIEKRISLAKSNDWSLKIEKIFLLSELKKGATK